MNYDDKTIIITYTENNYNNIRNKIIKKFNEIPPNMRIYTYFSFLYKFCFLPLKKNLNVKGIDYNTIKINGQKQKIGIIIWIWAIKNVSLQIGQIM